MSEATSEATLIPKAADTLPLPLRQIEPRQHRHQSCRLQRGRGSPSRSQPASIVSKRSPDELVGRVSAA